MGNWLSTSLTIGGTLREEDIDEFLAMAHRENLHWDWGGGEPITEEELREQAADPPEPLFMCGEANYGIFDDMEKWLTEHGLSWMRNNSSDGGDVNSGCQVSLPNEEYWIPCNNEGEAMVTVDVVEVGVAALRDGRIHDALDTFAKIRQIPKLPPFKIEP